MSTDGKTPIVKEILKISESWVERYTLVGIVLGPNDLFESREDMTLTISYLSVGLSKKESSDQFLRKLEKCLWEYLILSLVVVAMDVKKLLNMFAISIRYVRVVSLETRILWIVDWLLFMFKIDFVLFQVFLVLLQLVLK